MIGRYSGENQRTDIENEKRTLSVSLGLSQPGVEAVRPEETISNFTVFGFQIVNGRQTSHVLCGNFQSMEKRSGAFHAPI
jgi:hypothetical protein